MKRNIIWYSNLIKNYNYKKRSIKNNQNENIGIFTVFQSDNFKIDPFFEISNRE